MVGMLTAYAGPLVQRPIILLATTPLPRVAPIAMRQATSVTAAERKPLPLTKHQLSRRSCSPVP